MIKNLKKKNKINIGIAGFGEVGKRRFEVIKKNKNFKLIGVCDQNKKNLNSLDDKILQFTDYKELLKLKLDALIICLTNDVAAKVTSAALKKKLHVFCEKPPATNLSDLIKIINLKRSINKNLILLYGFNHRHHQSIKEAIKIIKSNNLGKIINLKGVYGKSKMIKFNNQDWRTKRKIAGGGILLDQGIHMLDLIRLFAGEFDEIKSFVMNNFWNYDVEDNAYAILRNKKGIIAMINSSATQWKHKFELEINCQYGTITLGGILSSTKTYGDETLKIQYKNKIKKTMDLKEKVIKYVKDPSWKDELELFQKYIVTNKKNYRGDINDAFKTMKLVFEIYYNDKDWRNAYSIYKPKNVN